jgi:uncharacterized protein
MDNPIQVDLGRIAQDLQIRRVQVESVVQLLDEGNTIPFITRYRKERTGNLSEVTIREIQIRVQRVRDLIERKETVLKTIEAQGKLTPELAAAIRAAENPKRLEDLYLPFKPKKRTKASEARERGLEPLAFQIWQRDETLTDLTAAAQEYVNAEKGIETPEKVLEGVGHILAEAISEMALVRDAVRKLVWKTGKLVTSKGEVAEGQGLEYRDYFDYTEPIAQIPPHRVLAINRGDKEGSLKVKLEVSRPDLDAAFFAQLPLEDHPQGDLFRAAAVDALERLILPSMEREVRRDLTEGAEKHAVDVFARNLRSLLLQPPIPRQSVMAIDPGFRTGCKIAVLNAQGDMLDQGVIFPHAPQNRRSEAKLFLKDLVGKHSIGVVAIGNGTACRETEELVAEIIAEGTAFSQNPDAVMPAPEPLGAGLPTPTEPTGTGEGGGEAQASDTSVGEAEAQSPEPPRHDHTEPNSHPQDPPIEPDAPPQDPAVDPITEGPAPDFVVESEGTGADEPKSAATLADISIENLPPITGGAPDPEAADAESPLAEMPDTTPPLPDPGATDATAAAAPKEEIGAGLPTPTESATEGLHEPDRGLTPSARQEEPEEIGAGLPTPTEPATEGLHAAAEPAPATEEPAPAAPEPAPGSEAEAKPSQGQGRGKQPGGGRGRSDQRPRGPKSKPAGPPPPQEPPKPHPADNLLAQLAYVIVNEAGASVYSTSQIGRDEFPDSDATLRSGISIGRRLQDPLAELVKIEPQNIGVGLYQHDISPKFLKETLDAVTSSCVNFVGVDLNTASVSLLRHVSGLNQLTARRVVEHRKEKGPFTNREQLIQVEGIGPASYTQAAGFLKILEGENPLDRTWVHPESYPAAAKLLEMLGFAPDSVRDKAKLAELRTKLAEVDVPAAAKDLEVGEPTLNDMIEALSRPERDPRDDLPKPIFKKGILRLEDLAPGMELKGTVLNVVDFGAFVDIGLKDSGLVHISQLANRYIKSPHDVVSVGDVVSAWVIGVDQERKRVSLTMVKPGTERPQRGPQGGGRGGQPREGQGQGQGGRRGGRGGGPRPPASSLTAPPVGAPPVTVLSENQGRRSDRGGPPAGPEGRPVLGPPVSNREGGRPNQGGGTGGGPRFGSGSPRGGGRGGYQGGGGGRSGPGRFDRPNAGPSPGPASRPSRPSKPAPPPPPLTKEALEGNVPLRTFGQLKQLWSARTDDPAESQGGPPSSAPDQRQDSGSSPASESGRTPQQHGEGEPTVTPGSE